MTREDIYEHLAQVYLGKKSVYQSSRRRHNKKKIVRQSLGMVIILGCMFYGATAFLAKNPLGHESKTIYSLNQSPIRIKYNLNEPYPPVKSFSIAIPAMNAEKYQSVNFSVRGTDDGYPGIIKILLKNRRNETSSFFVHDVYKKWKKVSIPVEEFKQITDWTTLTDISFILEAWNTEKKRGVILIDDVNLSS